MPWRLLLGALLLPLLAVADDFSFDFDLERYTPRPFQWGGYVGLRGERQWLDRDSAGALLRHGDEVPATRDRQVAELELDGRYRRATTTLHGTWHGRVDREAGESHGQGVLYQGYLSQRAGERTVLEVGKRSLRWGKGYAFNPVGFYDRPRDLLDPEQAREGFVLATADWVRSGAGPVQTLTLSPVIAPVTERLNEALGDAGTEFGGRLGLLYRDTDIDLMAVASDSRPDRWGVDFARNLAPHFAIHGEWAHIGAGPRPRVEEGALAQEQRGGQRWLLGLRYLTRHETTWILEYYHNSLGYSQSEMQAFYRAVENADAGQRDRLAQSPFTRPTPMREYLYLRAMQKAPFDALHWSAGATLIGNVADRSYNFSPEVSWTGITHLELRLRLSWLAGGRHTEFGERANDRRVELRGRYFF